ncbi:MAG: tetratricopeptide repeat protein [Nitrospinota bacterium]
MKHLYNAKSVNIVIIIIVSFGVYANTLLNGFVYDDREQILKNPWITDFQYIPDILFSPSWSFLEQYKHIKTNYYRPTMHLIYMAEYHIFGLKPWGWHLVNIVFHIINSLLVFTIATILINKSQIQKPESTILSPALLSALLFATHPINTEVVAWIACIPELSFTMFYLLSFYLYIKMQKAKENDKEGRLASVYYIPSIISFFLATLSKETALTIPILLIVYDYFKEENNQQIWLRNLKRYIPYGMVAIVYLLFRFYVLEGIAPKKPMHPYLNTFQYFINIFLLFIQYLKSLLLPINLSQFHLLNPAYSILEIKALTSIFITLFIPIIFYRLRKIDSLCLLSLFFIILPLLPVLYIPVLGINTFAERYLYLPSVGFALLLSLGLKQFVTLNFKREISVWFLMGVLVIICLYSFGTVKRNSQWKDDYILWKTAVERYPENYFAFMELGDIYLERGLLDEAIVVLKEAIRTNTLRNHPVPRILEVSRLNLVAAYYSKGLFGEAIEEYKEVIKANPNSDRLIASFQNAIKLAEKPSGISDIYSNLGNIYAITGLMDDAITYYEEALRIAPDNPVALHNIEVIRRIIHRKNPQ